MIQVPKLVLFLNPLPLRYKTPMYIPNMDKDKDNTVTISKGTNAITLTPLPIPKRKRYAERRRVLSSNSNEGMKTNTPINLLLNFLFIIFLPKDMHNSMCCQHTGVGCIKSENMGNIGGYA